MNEIMQNLFELQSLEFDATIQPGTEERIAELRARIPQPILSHYDRLGDRGKKGVALLRHQTCTGCHMRVPLGVVLELKRGEDVRLCDNCQRYLFIPAELVDGNAEPKKSRRRPDANNWCRWAASHQQKGTLK